VRVTASTDSAIVLQPDRHRRPAQHALDDRRDRDGEGRWQKAMQASNLPRTFGNPNSVAEIVNER
jgi:hypothetical protein